MDRFDLEQYMLNYHSYVENTLEMLYSNYDKLTDDQRMNILLGMTETVPLHFERMWKAFEESLAKKQL